MPELDRITVEGFKSIKSIVDLRLGAVNVLIGANGSGKSNFIGVFAFLHELRNGGLQDYVAKAGGANRILHFGAKTTVQMTVAITFKNDQGLYAIDLFATGDDRLVPTKEVVDHSYGSDSKVPQRITSYNLGGEARLSMLEVAIPDGMGQLPLFNQMRDCLDRWRIYHFHDTSARAPMKRTASVDDNRYLRADGSNIAAFLYLLKERHPASYNLICDAVRQMAPFFDGFQLAPLLLNPSTIKLEWRHKGSDAYFDVSALSDGTLRFIALATLFLQPEEFRPSIILVDEPELGLHPYAITLLASLVKQASVTSQVILSTQSPQLLDHFEPEDVLVAERIDGGTTLRRLESVNLSAWLEEYSLGQLWEKNEIGGRP